MNRLDREPLLLEFAAHAVQVLAVLDHFLRIRQVQRLLPLRRPSCGHVEQQDLGVGEAREFFDVWQQRRVGLTMVERDEDFLEHRHGLKLEIRT